MRGACLEERERDARGLASGTDAALATSDMSLELLRVRPWRPHRRAQLLIAFACVATGCAFDASGSAPAADAGIVAPGDDDPVAPDPTRRRVFITSTRHSGNLGGLAGADALCQERADAVGLGGRFGAYMRDDDTGLGRLERSPFPYVRLDGVVVADDFSDLRDGSIKAPLNVDENGKTVSGKAWIGLVDVLGGASNSCNNWRSTDTDCLRSNICGGAGQSSEVNTNWDGYYIYNCNRSYRLYCVEQES